MLLLLLLLLLNVSRASEEAAQQDAAPAVLVEEELEPATAVLFPWFSEVLGVLTVYVLTRYCRALPSMAIMFALGTLVGVAVMKNENMRADTLQESVIQWAGIDGELLLLIFLPGCYYSWTPLALTSICFKQASAAVQLSHVMGEATSNIGGRFNKTFHIIIIEGLLVTRPIHYKAAFHE